MPSVPNSIAAVLVLALSACSSDPSDPSTGDVSVQADKMNYSFASDTGVRTTVYNRRSDRIYVGIGEIMHLQQWSDNGWIDLGPWLFVDGIGRSFPLAAGDSLVMPAMSLGYLPRRAGTYRLIYRLWLDPRGRWPLPEEQRAAEFRVNWE
jgi:hypothetical protein